MKKQEIEDIEINFDEVNDELDKFIDNLLSDNPEPVALDSIPEPKFIRKYKE